MPLVNMQEMLNHAYQNGYAVGGFDLVSLDFLEAIMQAAEVTRSPVILSLAFINFMLFLKFSFFFLNTFLNDLG